MKIATPASYQKVFAIPTASSTAVVSPHRALLLVVNGGNGSITVTTIDGTSTTISSIPNNTVFILPVVVKYINIIGTYTTVYGLL